MKTEDFVELCKKGEREIAMSYVNELWEDGKDIKAEQFRRIFLQCQVDFELDLVFVPYEHPTPPVLESWWYEGAPKEYDELARETAENAEAVYQAHKEKFINAG